MEDGTVQPFIDVCLSCSMVQTRNARAPDTAIHPLTQVRISTAGRARPFVKRPIRYRINMCKRCERK
eukprot:6191820-Pleurochrysis_carterae.AAC.1